MIATTLVANGATVYIIGPKQADLDKIAKVYNDAAHKISSMGKIYGLEGDVRQKVCSVSWNANLSSESLTLFCTLIVGGYPACARNWETRKIHYCSFQQRRDCRDFIYIWCS